MSAIINAANSNLPPQSDSVATYSAHIIIIILILDPIQLISKDSCHDSYFLKQCNYIKMYIVRSMLMRILHLAQILHTFDK
jgi:hypothetical protein